MPTRRSRLVPARPTLPTGAALADTRRWLERAVIGLDLCPFARAPYARGQVRMVVTEARTERALLDALSAELARLQDTPPEILETTLLVHPYVLTSFRDYNAFLARADALLAAEGLVGEVQIASFHPQYRFAGTAHDAIDNYTNRSPHPILHLLREDSISRAARAIPGTATLYEVNVARLRALGRAGWARLASPRMPPA